MTQSRALGLIQKPVELRQVRYFLALCEELNFTRAARKCGVAQPSVTISIRQLEERLGGTLFERTPRVRLTDFGAAIRPHLQAIAFQVSQVLEIAQRYHVCPERDGPENLIDAATAQVMSFAVLAPPSGGNHDDRFTP
jgi:DNA-binding transcriptional LysR family regulator